MAIIKSINAREILDSRGNPTVEVDLTTEDGLFRAAVPSGASVGHYEALELRDKDNSRFNGLGVMKAVDNVNKVIAKELLGKSLNQKEIDELMVKTLDGTKNEWGYNKQKLGANAILAVSMAVCRAGAAEKKLPLYKHIAELAGIPTEKMIMPLPCFNVINGGAHAGNKLAFQEFMVMPVGAKTFKEAVQIGAEVYRSLKDVLKKKYGIDATNVGDEGGFVPTQLKDNTEALSLLMEAIKQSGHETKVKIGMDVAASEFYTSQDSKYDLNYKLEDNDGSGKMTGDNLIELYKNMSKDYPIASIEDPFDQDDFESYTKLTADIGQSIQIVGDDLLVTNALRIQKAQNALSCNALLLKINQIGSITEAIEAYSLARSYKWGVMVSHRSGETEDSFIAHLAVGLGAGEIKSGAPCRGERTAKYNELMRIEEELGDNCVFAGEKFRGSYV